MISVVIPTLDAAASLAGALASLRPAIEGRLVGEVVVADGGSGDGTRETARAYGCVVVEGERGRGVQLARGAEAARGEWLLFLHADTRLSREWADEAGRFLAGAGASERAAVFTYALDDLSWKARLLERIVAARVRALGLPYGDQGLLIARELYQRLGGFGAVPLMEDVDLIRRLGRGRITLLKATAVTSADRYRRDGYLRRMVRNATCLSLFFAGIPPRYLVRLYGREAGQAASTRGHGNSRLPATLTSREERRRASAAATTEGTMGNDNTDQSKASGGTKLNPGDEGIPGTPGTGENLCPDCGGTGKLNNAPCRTCGGTGKVIEGIGGG